MLAEDEPRPGWVFGVTYRANGITWRVTFGNAAASPSRASCAAITWGPPTWRRAAASSNTLIVDEDLESFDVTARIQITNPPRPERGTVRVSDLAGIEWDCPYRDNPATCAGILADTIIPILRDRISSLTT